VDHTVLLANNTTPVTKDLRDSAVIVNDYLHRCAFGRHGRKTTDVTEIDGHAFILLSFDGFTVHKLNCHRPDKSMQAEQLY